jgi:hypothetical protein
METKRLSSLFALAVLLWLLCAPLVLAQSQNQGPDPGTVAGTFIAVWLVLLICFVSFAVISICIQIYLCYFMYTDAEARGENGVLWAVLGLFLGLVGLIIWLCIRPEKGRGRRRRR